MKSRQQSIEDGIFIPTWYVPIIDRVFSRVRRTFDFLRELEARLYLLHSKLTKADTERELRERYLGSSARAEYYRWKRDNVPSGYLQYMSSHREIMNQLMHDPLLIEIRRLQEILNEEPRNHDVAQQLIAKNISLLERFPIPKNSL